MTEGSMGDKQLGLLKNFRAIVFSLDLYKAKIV
jgi:hypothetical protein